MAGNDNNAPRSRARRKLDDLVTAARARGLRQWGAGKEASVKAPPEGETQEIRVVEGGSDRAGAPDLRMRLREAWRDPAQRQWLFLGAAGFLLLLGIIFVAPAFVREGAEVADQAANGAPAAEPEVAGEESPLRRTLFTALPLLLGLFWLLSAWLVDSEARRAFVIQEPWGERRTLAYSALAVGCVFPLILAGLIFSAWGFVTFVLDVSRRQSAMAGLQAGAIILLIGSGFLLLRGAIVRWLENRRAP